MFYLYYKDVFHNCHLLCCSLIKAGFVASYNSHMLVPVALLVPYLFTLLHVPPPLSWVPPGSSNVSLHLAGNMLARLASHSLLMKGSLCYTGAGTSEDAGVAPGKRWVKISVSGPLTSAPRQQRAHLCEWTPKRAPVSRTSLPFGSSSIAPRLRYYLFFSARRLHYFVIPNVSPPRSGGGVRLSRRLDRCLKK